MDDTAATLKEESAVIEEQATVEVEEGVKGPPGQGELFSITGLKGMKLPRHRDQVTVFPSGCMGVASEDDSAPILGTAPMRGRRFLRASELQERDSGHLEGVPRRRPPSASHRHAQQRRNPLTGEGYLETDFICGHGKHQSIGIHDQKKEPAPEKKKQQDGESNRPLAIFILK